jgi:hypothetical protein
VWKRSAQALRGESESKLTFARSIVSSANFRRRSLRSIACSDAPATPPPPNLLPTRFYSDEREVSSSFEVAESLQKRTC